MGRTEALLFDLDDTLLVDDNASAEARVVTAKNAAERHALDAETLAAEAERQAERLWRASPTFTYCHAIGISASEGMWGRFEGEDANLRALRAWVGEFRRETWGRALAAQGVTDGPLAEELAQRFQDERRVRQILYPDVEPMLERFRRSNYRLGLVTNGAPDLQREKIAATGIARHFDAIVVSGEMGAGKPERRIFAHALELVGAGATGTVMVGDNLRRDVAGAQAIGMRGIWITRMGQRQAAGSPFAPDGIIATLDELEAYL